MHKLAATLTVFALLLSFAPRAHAGAFSLSIGRDVAAVDLTGARGVTNLGTRIGYRYERVHGFFTGDYARYSSKKTYETEDFDDVGSKAQLITLGLGGRYLFREPKADRAVPYVVGTGFTVIPSVDIEESVPKAITDSTAYGFLGGFGVDYFFGDAFSIGGEVGANGLFASYTDATSTWRGSVVQLYSGIELTFYIE